MQMEKMRVDLENESLQKRERIETELKAQHQKVIIFIFRVVIHKLI